MNFRRLALVAPLLLIAHALHAEDSECARNYHSTGTGSETFVTTGLTPHEVTQKLPQLLAGAGAEMQWADAAKSLIKAATLEVQSSASGATTIVTFRSSAGADNAALCRFAALVPPVPKPVVLPPQDPQLIAQIKNDLLIKHELVQPGPTIGLNHVRFRSGKDILSLVISAIRPPTATAREYDVTLLVERAACAIADEDLDDTSGQFVGAGSPVRTKPARVDATLVYMKEGAAWQLTDATITHIESIK